MRMTRADGTFVSADVVMTSSGDEWSTEGARCVVAVLADSIVTNVAAAGACPAIETWSTIAQQIQAMGGDVRCIGIGLVAQTLVEEELKSGALVIALDIPSELKTLVGSESLRIAAARRAAAQRAEGRVRPVRPRGCRPVPAGAARGPVPDCA